MFDILENVLREEFWNFLMLRPLSLKLEIILPSQIVENCTIHGICANSLPPRLSKLDKIPPKLFYGTLNLGKLTIP
jgi:hypothetical protein